MSNPPTATQSRDQLVALLKRRRLAQGLTIKQVAEALRVTTATVSWMESGRHDPRAALLIRYGALLGLRLEWTADTPLLRRSPLYKPPIRND